VNTKARARLINLMSRMNQKLEPAGNTRVYFFSIYSKPLILVKVLQGVSARFRPKNKGAAKK